jgi:hypothetical protein
MFVDFGPSDIGDCSFRTVIAAHKPSSESAEARVAQTAVLAVCGFHSGLTDKAADLKNGGPLRCYAGVFREDDPRPFGSLVWFGDGTVYTIPAALRVSVIPVTWSRQESVNVAALTS